MLPAVFRGSVAGSAEHKIEAGLIISDGHLALIII